MANNNIIDSTDDRPGDNEHSEDDMAVDLEGGGNATSANEGNNTNNNNNNSPIAPPTAGAPPAARESAAASRYDDTDSDEESANRVPSPINNHNTNNTTHSDSDNDDSDDDNDDSDEDSNAADRLRTNNNREIIPAAAAVVEQPMLALGQDDTTGTVAHIRGTDVHVPTAAAAFADFLQTFVSLRHSQQANQRHQQQQQTRRRRRNPSRRDGTENDDDASSLASSNSSDDEEDPPVEATVVGGVPFYTTKLRALLLHTNSEETASLAMDTMHLFYHNAECQRLYHQLVQYPMELVPLMDLLVQRELERLLLVLANENEDDEVDMEDRILPRVQVRPYNLQSVSNLRELDPVCMDTLVCCKGMIVRSSPIIPDLKVAHFGCSICGETATVTIDRGRIAEPANRCPTCHTANAWQIQHNRCVFADKQLVRLQETPDEVPAGQTPASVVTFCFDDLVDSVQPGDKVEVTGVLRAQPVRVNPKISKVKAVYKTYLDVIHFRSVTGMESNILRHNPDSTSSTTPSSSSSGKESQWTEQRIQELRDLSRDADIYQKLTDSLAPSIWELDNCKKGILCMLFGGNHVRVKRGTAAAAAAAASTTRATNAHEQNWIDQHDDDDDDMHDNANDHVVAAAASAAGGSSTSKLNKRGDINILLCGDPGTSKSQLLSYVNKLSTRGVYTSGKGSSAVGLTASVVRDPETRDLVLESGALVLSDQGICCIDEFDKMSDTTRSVLHEAMEQQTVSIAKAG